MKLTKQIMGFIFVLWIICCFRYADSTCTFPSGLENTWISSNNGEVVINSTHMTYAIYARGTFLFECHLLSGTKYILRSEEFPLYSSTGRATICFEFEYLKAGLYRYLIYTSELADANYQRVKFIASTTTVTEAVACDDVSNTDSSILMESGSIATVKTQCPDAFLGQFTYTFNETDCLNDTATMDVCTDTSLMTFNYTACSTIQAHSFNGSVNCIYYSTSGTTTSLYVYNLDDTTDESTYYQFTCYKLESSGGLVYATQYPQDCHSSQTSTSVDGPGATMNMTASITCVPTTTTAAATTSVSSAGLVGGVVAALAAVIIIGVIIGYVVYRKKFKKERVEPRKGLPPTSTGRGEKEDDELDKEYGIEEVITISPQEEKQQSQKHSKDSKALKISSDVNHASQERSGAFMETRKPLLRMGDGTVRPTTKTKVKSMKDTKDTKEKTADLKKAVIPESGLQNEKNNREKSNIEESSTSENPAKSDESYYIPNMLHDDMTADTYWVQTAPVSMALSKADLIIDKADDIETKSLYRGLLSNVQKSIALDMDRKTSTDAKTTFSLLNFLKSKIITKGVEKFFRRKDTGLNTKENMENTCSIENGSDSVINDQVREAHSQINETSEICQNSNKKDGNVNIGKNLQRKTVITENMLEIDINIQIKATAISKHVEETPAAKVIGKERDNGEGIQDTIGSKTYDKGMNSDVRVSGMNGSVKDDFGKNENPSSLNVTCTHTDLDGENENASINKNMFDVGHVDTTKSSFGSDENSLLENLTDVKSPEQVITQDNDFIEVMDQQTMAGYLTKNSKDNASYSQTENRNIRKGPQHFKKNGTNDGSVEDKRDLSVNNSLINKPVQNISNDEMGIGNGSYYNMLYYEKDHVESDLNCIGGREVPITSNMSPKNCKFKDQHRFGTENESVEHIRIVDGRNEPGVGLAVNENENTMVDKSDEFTKPHIDESDPNTTTGKPTCDTFMSNINEGTESEDVPFIKDIYESISMPNVAPLKTQLRRRDDLRQRDINNDKICSNELKTPLPKTSTVPSNENKVQTMLSSNTASSSKTSRDVLSNADTTNEGMNVPTGSIVGTLKKRDLVKHNTNFGGLIGQTGNLGSNKRIERSSKKFQTVLPVNPSEPKTSKRKDNEGEKVKTDHNALHTNTGNIDESDISPGAYLDIDGRKCTDEQGEKLPAHESQYHLETNALETDQNFSANGQPRKISLEDIDDSEFEDDDISLSLPRLMALERQNGDFTFIKKFKSKRKRKDQIKRIEMDWNKDSLKEQNKERNHDKLGELWRSESLLVERLINKSVPDARGNSDDTQVSGEENENVSFDGLLLHIKPNQNEEWQRKTARTNICTSNSNSEKKIQADKFPQLLKDNADPQITAKSSDIERDKLSFPEIKNLENLSSIGSKSHVKENKKQELRTESKRSGMLSAPSVISKKTDRRIPTRSQSKLKTTDTHSNVGACSISGTRSKDNNKPVQGSEQPQMVERETTITKKVKVSSKKVTKTKKPKKIAKGSKQVDGRQGRSTIKKSSQATHETVNYDRYGEKEEILKEAKPNKFRFDQLPNIKRDTRGQQFKSGKVPKEKKSIVQKLKKSSFPLIVAAEPTLINPTELQKSAVASSSKPKANYESAMKDLKIIPKLPSVNRSAVGPRKIRRRKRVRRSKSCIERRKPALLLTDTEDSDIEIDWDPSRHFNGRGVGRSARPSTSADLQDLIVKIRESSLILSRASSLVDISSIH